MIRLAAVLFCLVAVAWPAPTLAQGGVSEGVLTLNRAQSRMDEGRIREARVELMQWWNLHPDGIEADSLGVVRAPQGELQRALWLRGLLTVDPRIADVDFRRLVMEFPQGSFTGQARLRLAQSAHAQGDLAGATEHFVALERDFPAGGLRLAARAWLDHYAPGTARVLERPERVQQPDTITMPAATVAVELGSFRDPRVARELLERATSAGLESRVAQMSDGSHSVRMGRYTIPSSAAAARARARALGFPARVVPIEDRTPTPDPRQRD